MKLYKCDPAKNTECSGYGTSCGVYCGMTAKKECSTDGRPLSEEEQEKLERELEYNASGNNREATTWEKGD